MPSSFIAARWAFSLLLAIPPPKSNINPVSLAFSTNLCWVGIVSLGSRAGGPTYVVFAYMIHPSQELVLATCTTCSKESLSARVTNRFRFVRKCITITMISSFSSHRWGTLFKKFVKCKSNISHYKHHGQNSHPLLPDLERITKCESNLKNLIYLQSSKSCHF